MLKSIFKEDHLMAQGNSVDICFPPGECLGEGAFAMINVANHSNVYSGLGQA